MKNKKTYLLALVFSSLYSTSVMSQVYDNAPSLWLGPQISPQADIMLQDLMVPLDTNAQSTYYSTLNWNAGADGGGYCGLQNSSNGGNLTIFSLWDPASGDTTASIVYAYPGVVFSRFGGEGTGWHVIKNNMWTENNWYTLLTRRWDVGTHTYFGYWIQSITDSTWTHYVTIDYPEAGVYFDAQNSGNSFIEDWIGDGQDMRKVYYTNGYSRSTTSSAWVPFSPYVFSFTQQNLTTYPNGNKWNAGIAGNAIFLQTGGNTVPTLVSGQTYTWALNIPPIPAKPVIKFTIDSIADSNIYWSVPNTATAQFGYTVSVNGVVAVTAIAQEARSVAYGSAVPGAVISLTLEDVLGNTATHTITVVPSAINPVTNNNIINIFPIPTQGGFWVEGLTTGQTINLYDISGRQLSGTTAAKSSMALNISSQPNGVYFVRILNKDGSFVTQQKISKVQ